MKELEFISQLPLVTERLYLRKAETKDIRLLLKLDQDEKVQEFLGGKKTSDVKERKAFWKKKMRKTLTIILKSTNEGIGFINLKFDEERSRVELSYIFDSDYWKKGYCTEISKYVIRVLFEQVNIHEVYADSFSKNINSIRVLENIGMKRINERTELFAINDSGTQDYFVDYSIINEEGKSYA